MITIHEMRELENNCGIPKLTLMENAGRAVYQILKERMDLKNKKILIVCYHGNNGGDGFVAAKYLCEESDVTVLFIGDEARLKEESKINYKKIIKNELIQFLTNVEDVDFNDFDIIIDAILGTGVIGKLKEPIAAIIDNINNSNAFKLSVDIPTGIDPDKGIVIDKMVNADLIISFHDIKAGLSGLKDKVVVADIGIPKQKGL